MTFFASRMTRNNIITRRTRKVQRRITFPRDHFANGRKPLQHDTFVTTRNLSTRQVKN